MDEYIERETAIDAMTADNLLEHFDSVEDAIEKRFHRAAERVLVKIPAADVRPVVRGRWQAHSKVETPVYHCSVCGGAALHAWGKQCKSDFCPNCGAKMDGGQEE